ncbi:MAG: hypothetical protein JO336_19820 [Acidobacteriia bacterium]|nr:hypothetical protein [Terriglobia bacterium]
MRPLEILITAFTLVAALSLPWQHGPAPQIAAFIAVMLLVPHVWVEGAHWQMFPIYAAALVVVWGAMGRPPAGPLVSAFAVTLVLAGGASSWALPMFRLPKPTGKYPVGTRTIYLADPERLETHEGAPSGNRELAVQLWYPSAVSRGRKAVYRRWRETELRSTYQCVLPTDSIQDAPAAVGLFPVLIFNHAWRGFRNRSTFLTQELASHGFIVAAISHPYNCAAVELPGHRVVRCERQPDIGDFQAEPHLSLEKRTEIAGSELCMQTGDCRFLLDRLSTFHATPGHPLEGRLDLERVGAFGHSFGGAVAVELSREDARVKAALELDGVLHGSAAESGLAKPLMLIDAAQTLQLQAPGSHLDGRARESELWWKSIGIAKQSTLKRFGGYRVVIDGVTHENFSDKGFMSPLRRLTGIGVLPQRQAASIIAAYTVAFFRWTLSNEPQPVLSAGARPFQEARFENWFADRGLTCDRR